MFSKGCNFKRTFEPLRDKLFLISLAIKMIFQNGQRRVAFADSRKTYLPACLFCSKVAAVLQIFTQAISSAKHASFFCKLAVAAIIKRRANKTFTRVTSVCNFARCLRFPLSDRLTHRVWFSSAGSICSFATLKAFDSGIAKRSVEKTLTKWTLNLRPALQIVAASYLHWRAGMTRSRLLSTWKSFDGRLIEDANERTNNTGLLSGFLLRE